MISGEYQIQSRVLKALAHPVRLQIVEELDRSQEACVCHLEHLLRQRQAYISQQLAVLREAGLVSDRRDGLNVYYSLAPTVDRQSLQAIRQLAAGLAAAEGWELPAAEPPGAAELTVAVDCPCPRCN